MNICGQYIDLNLSISNQLVFKIKSKKKKISKFVYESENYTSVSHYPSVFFFVGGE